jgi:putative SOS response-associated peptidase YedK
MIRANYRDYVRMFGAHISIREFVELYVERSEDSAVIIPKAMSAAFLQDPQSPDEHRIVELVREFDAARETKLQQTLFEQLERQTKARRKLEVKHTKTAENDLRISTEKIDDARWKLANLGYASLKSGDSRIFPKWYAPVMILEDGQHVIKPMRFQLRPAGMPASFDVTHEGSYNSRRDNLRRFWRKQFGHTHGLILVDRFYENVKRHRLEQRELGPDEKPETVRLEFEPNPPHLMLVPCIWSRWSAPGQKDLLSFAAITDEPPPEVAAAGHDRCLVPIKPGNVDLWLTPQGRSLDALDEILEDKEHPYYEHRMAA